MVAFSPLLDRDGDEFIVWIDRRRDWKEKGHNGWNAEVVLKGEGHELRATYSDFDSVVVEHVHGSIHGQPVELTSVYEIGRGLLKARQPLIVGDGTPLQSDIRSRVDLLLGLLSPVRDVSRSAPSRRKSPSKRDRRSKAG